MKGERRYMRGYVLRDDTDDGQADDKDKAGKPLTIVAATEGRKGDGLNLTMAGAELGRFEANPVLGYGHSYWGRDGLPIGRSDKTWIDGEALKRTGSKRGAPLSICMPAAFQASRPPSSTDTPS